MIQKGSNSICNFILLHLKGEENCWECVGQLAITITKCIEGGFSGEALVACVEDAVATGSTCYDCICYAIKAMTPWHC